MIRNILVVLSLLASHLAVVGQVVASVSPLQRAERATQVLLSSTDRRSLTYILPSWQDEVEQSLSLISHSDAAAWTPVLGGQQLQCGSLSSHPSSPHCWAGLWQRGSHVWVVWMAVRPSADGNTEAMAFADEVSDLNDTAQSLTLSVVPQVEQGLLALQLSNPEGKIIYSVPDVGMRMDLRTLTDYGYSHEQKDVAEARMLQLVDMMPGLVTAADLSGWPELLVTDAPSNSGPRFVTYMVANKDFSSHCGGWLVLRSKKENKVIPLHDATDKVGQPEQAILSPAAWYGALYSRIIPFRYDRKECYLLEGFKGADALVKRRVVDVLCIDNGQVTFGAKVFLHPKETYRRRVFSYSARASMSMFYDEKNEMFVMDHLEPSNPLLTGQFAFYGPDLSYDAYLLTKDGWKYQNDIQITIEKGAQPNPEVQETASDRLTQPGNGSVKRQNTGGSSSWGRGTQRQNAGSKPSNSWFDKGKGNSAPNIRRR